MRRVIAPAGARDVLYGEAPYGWRLSKDRARLVQDHDEQRVIAVVRHMYFVTRVPMRDIVARLKEMRIVNRRAKPFGLSRVFEMIHSTGQPPREAAKTRVAAGKKPVRAASRKQRGR